MENKKKKLKRKKGLRLSEYFKEFKIGDKWPYLRISLSRAVILQPSRGIQGR